MRSIRTLTCIFAEILSQEHFGSLYKEIHFAIPAMDNNAAIFEDILSRLIDLQRVQPGTVSMDNTPSGCAIV